MILDNFSDLFQRGLEYAWDSEHLLLRQLPKMIEAASNGELRQALEVYLAETKKHIYNLEQIFTRLDRSPAAEKSEPIRILVDECDRMLGHLDASPLRDAVMVFVSTQIESYETGLYRSLAEFAKTLRLEEAIQLLDEIQSDERSAVEQMTRLAQSTINAAAAGTHNPPPFALI